MKNRAAIALVALISWAPLSFADDDIGIFETILKSSVSFAETNQALQQAIASSELQLQATHDVRVPKSDHQARVYVLTSPTYARAAAEESPRTVSAQILRVAVFTTGDEQETVVNMANPVAHALVFYADSPRHETLVAAAYAVADEIRQLVGAVPGTKVSIQAEPVRAAKKYRKFNGDGPAKMMARFRSWSESQLLLLAAPAAEFDAMVEKVVARLQGTAVNDADDAAGWEVISQIRLRDDVVHLGLTNPYIEDKMIRINSRFRSDGKGDASPYPGVDHVAALPTEVLIVKEGNKASVLHYGQMWRMQLYFWDSGYRAFTANVGVPGTIVNSIEGAVQADQ